MLSKILVILMVISFIFSNEYCYSEEEVKEIYTIINECDYKDSLSTEIQINLEGQVENCELINNRHKLLITELETQLELKDDLIKLVSNHLGWVRIANRISKCIEIRIQNLINNKTIIEKSGKLQIYS